MANRERGEVALRSGGKVYTLRLDFNALCDLEDTIGRPIHDLDFGKPSMRLTRTVVAVALRANHPEIDERGAGDIVQGAGVPVAVKAMVEALNAAFPDVPADAGNG
jgi:hypothetical protein